MLRLALPTWLSWIIQNEMSRVFFLSTLLVLLGASTGFVRIGSRVQCTNSKLRPSFNALENGNKVDLNGRSSSSMTPAGLEMHVSSGLRASASADIATSTSTNTIRLKKFKQVLRGFVLAIGSFMTVMLTRVSRTVAAGASSIGGWDLYGRVPFDDWLFST